MANFRTMARAVDLLGKNQIADLPTAITEIWKNGYDAYGDALCADLFISGCNDIDRDIFIISDDGTGMNQNDLLTKWVVLGTATKAGAGSSVSKETFGKKARIPLGEKGIGRLSVSYLGDHMLMVTQTSKGEANALFMNWKILNNPELFLDDIEIPIRRMDYISQLPSVYHELLKDYEENLDDSAKWANAQALLLSIKQDLDRYSSIPETIQKHITKLLGGKQHGTIFIIFDPIDELQQIASDRDDDYNEELNNRARYLKSALSGLFNPLDDELTARREHECGNNYAEYPSLNIHYSDGTSRNFLSSEGEFFTKQDFYDCEHWIQGKFDSNGVFRGKIKVYGRIINEFQYATKHQEALQHCGAIRLQVAFWEGNPANSTMPKEKWNLYEKKGKSFSGFYIYRDGFRVLPYGRTEYDFLDFEERRSLNAGRYYFSHRKMFGCLEITREGNPKLIDKAGREGMVANNAYRELQSVLKQFFIGMADEYYGNRASARSDAKEIKQQERRKKILDQEKQQQKKKIKELRVKIYQYAKQLASVESEIQKMTELCNAYDDHACFDSSQAEKMQIQADNVNDLIRKIEITVSPDIDIENNEEAVNEIEAYEERYQKAKNQLRILYSIIQKHIYANVLKESYLTKRKKIIEEIKETKERTYQQFSDKNAALFNELEDAFDQGDRKIALELPSIQGNSVSEADINRILQKAESLFDSWIEEAKKPIDDFMSFYESIHVGSEELEKKGATLHEINKLQDENALLLEMAQVGMSVQQQDHQMNALYAKIKEAIMTLKQTKNKETERQIHLLAMLFGQMEDIYKKMKPLYRQARRTKTKITGKQIISTINAFYGEKLKSNAIALLSGKGMEDYSIVTYESILLPAILNIIDNAIYWLKDANNRIIELFSNDSKELIIANSGVSMKPAEMERCFSMFYSNKPFGRGIGMYLAKTTLNSVGLDIRTTKETSYNKYQGSCFVISEVGSNE